MPRPKDRRKTERPAKGETLSPENLKSLMKGFARRVGKEFKAQLVGEKLGQEEYEKGLLNSIHKELFQKMGLSGESFETLMLNRENQHFLNHLLHNPRPINQVEFSNILTSSWRAINRLKIAKRDTKDLKIAKLDIDKYDKAIQEEVVKVGKSSDVEVKISEHGILQMRSLMEMELYVRLGEKRKKEYELIMLDIRGGLGLRF